MTTNHDTPASTAAIDPTLDTEALALSENPESSLLDNPPNDNSSAAETPGAVTPLERILDWDELERRLQAVETGAAPESHPGDHAPEPPVEALPPTDAPGALPKNYRFRTEDPQRARFYQLMRQHPEANPAELARLAGYNTESVPVPATGSAPEPNPSVDHLQPLRDEIAALAEQKRQHREAYEFDKADELGERLLEARLELDRRTRETAATGHTDAPGHYDTAYADARAEAERLHPGAAQPGTRQHRLLRMLVAAKEQEAPEFFRDPAYPLRLLGELERDFPESFPRGAGGRARAVFGPAAPSRLLGQAVAGSATSSQAADPGYLLQQIDHLSAEQLFALANAVGTHATAD